MEIVRVRPFLMYDRAWVVFVVNSGCRAGSGHPGAQVQGRAGKAKEAEFHLQVCKSVVVAVTVVKRRDFTHVWVFDLGGLPTTLCASEKMSKLFQDVKVADGRRIDATKAALLDWLIAEKQMLQTQLKVWAPVWLECRAIGAHR